MSTRLHWPRRYPNGVTAYKPKPGAARQQYRVCWTSPNGERRNLWRTSLADADAAAHEVARQLGAHAAGEPTQQFGTITELAAAYTTHGDIDLQWSTSHTRGVRQALDKWVLPHVGNRTAASMSPVDMHALIARARQAGIDPRNLAIVLRGMATYARRFGYTATDMMDGVTIPTAKAKQQGQAAVYVDESLRPDTASVEALALAGDDVWSLAVRLAAYTGLRWGELFELRVGDVNLHNGTIHVCRQVRYDVGVRHLHLPKYRKVRDTFVPGFLDGALAAHIDSLPAAYDDTQPCPDGCREAVELGRGPRLFTAPRGGWLNPSGFHSRMFRPACQQAGWPRAGDGWKWTWHSLRHHACTWMLAAEPDGLGLEVADVAMFAGHSTPASTWQMYVSTRQGAVARAVAASRRG